MSGGGGPDPGWGWWPPSRRRWPPHASSSRRRAAAASGAGWALPVAVAAAAAGALWLLVAALGLLGGACALSLAAAAAAGGAWAASGGGSGLAKGRRAAPPPPPQPGGGDGSSLAPSFSPFLANGGPALALTPRTAAGRRRLCGGDHLTPPAHFVLTPRRRYPIHQAQYASLGTLPSVCWDNHWRKARLSARTVSLVQSPVTVKIARPDSHVGRSPLLSQEYSPAALSPAPDCRLDPCAKETVLSALKESRKRAVEEEEEEEGDEDENRSFLRGQESKRRRHNSSGSGNSAFEPLVANGAPASLVPKPGSLKRALLSHCPDDASSKRSRTSSLSSVSSVYAGGMSGSIRNAIASSYSSTRGLSQLWKRSGPSISPLSSPASSRSQTPERPNKKARCPDSGLAEEASHQHGVSTLAKADKEVRAEKTAETPVSRHGALGATASSGSHGKRTRKIQLLSTRRADRFTLPPPPQLGYAVTSEDLDAEKKAALQWFNKVLEEKPDATPGPPAEGTSGPTTLPFPLVPAKPVATSSPVTTVGTNPLLESLKKMPDRQSCPAQADSSAALGPPQLPAPPVSLDQGSPTPVTSSETKPPGLGIPTSLVAAAAPPPSSAALPAGAGSSLETSVSEMGQTPVRPSSAPKPSILFGILTSPVTSPATSQLATVMTTASPAPSTTPLFKPIFGSLPKCESPASSSAAAATPSAAPPAPGPPASSTPSSVVPSNTFKPIFGEMPPPTATAAPPIFAFKQSPPLLPAPNLPPTSASGFPALSKAGVATSAALSATTSVTTLSASKPVFSFSLGATSAPSSIPSTSASAVAAPSASQPFLFGAPSGAAATATTPSSATVPLFQFGKLASSKPLASSAFRQAPSSTADSAPAAATASSFSFFGGGGATQATLAPPATTQPPPPLTFGSSSAFGGAFGAPSKPPPPYTASAGQLTFDAGVSDGQQAAAKPAAGPLSFGTPFNFAGSVAQPAFGGAAAQTPFGGGGAGGPGPLASFGAKNAAPPPFGSTTSGFFGATSAASTTSAFGSNTQTTSSSAGALFGSSNPSSFTFGVSGRPAAAAGSAFGMGGSAGTAGGGAPAPVGFSFGGGQSGAAGAATPFGSSLAQTQSSPFAFCIPGAPEGKPAFGGAPTPTFGQSSPAPGAGAAGSSTLSFGNPITPAFGGAAPAFGGPATPAFSIGAGSKPGAARQRLQARRQHPRKK